MTVINNDQGQWFDNVTEFIDFVDGVGAVGNSSHSIPGRYDSGWYGTSTFEEAVSLARNGWPEGLEKAAMFDAVLEQIIAEKMFEPEAKWDVSGDWIDIGRFVTGEPEVFGEYVETEVQRTATPPKIIRIVVNVCVSAGVDTGVIIKRGAAMTALVTALERHGRRCEIDVVAPNQMGYNSQRFDLVIRAKEAGEPMQLDKMVFLMAHPAILRRLIFSSWEHGNRDATPSRHSGYGRVAEMPDDQRGDIYLGGADLRRGNWDLKSAEAWILNTLAEQGIALKEKVTS